MNTSARVVCVILGVHVRVVRDRLTGRWIDYRSYSCPFFHVYVCSLLASGVPRGPRDPWPGGRGPLEI